MTTFVEQRYPTDCMLACIAMALDLTWEEVFAAAVECEAYSEDHTEGTRNELDVLKTLGLIDTWKWSEKRFIGYDKVSINTGDYTQVRRGWGEASYRFIRICWGRPAIISVPSLNKVDGSHAIYYDGGSIYDPNPLTRNRYENISIEEIPANVITMFRPNIGKILAARRLIL